MTPPSTATLLDEAQGVQLWKLAPDRDQFVVSTGRGRARLLGSLDSARPFFSQLVRQARAIRAH